MLAMYRREDAERIASESEKTGDEAAPPLKGRGSRANMDAREMQPAGGRTPTDRVIPRVGEDSTPRPNKNTSLKGRAASRADNS